MILETINVEPDETTEDSVLETSTSVRNPKRRRKEPSSSEGLSSAKSAILKSVSTMQDIISQRHEYTHLELQMKSWTKVIAEGGSEIIIHLSRDINKYLMLAI